MARCRISRLIDILTISTIAFLIVNGILQIFSDPTEVILNRKADTPLEQQRVNTSITDAKETKMDKRVQENTYKKIVKTRNSSVYMYSAIQSYLNKLGPKKNGTPSTEGTTKAQRSMIVVSGWELNKNQSSNFICCHMMENGTVISIPSSKKSDSPDYMRNVKLQAKQYTCHNINNSSYSQLISIESPGFMCPIDKRNYIAVETMFPNCTLQQNNRNKTIAVCSKLAYGSLDARRLIEWFEVHRLFGVDKVFSYLYKLNSTAKKVFEYYENLGIVETREFNLPDKESVNREIGSPFDIQYWNDEQVALFDCQERTRNFDYFAVVDTDEFIVPSTNVFKNAWKTFFNKMFKKPYLAGFFALVRVHVINWGPSMPNHPLFIGQYNNCTVPWYDRQKGIHMPARVQPGSVFTHAYEPLPGYRHENIDGELASLHHFRRCREEWLKPRSFQEIEQWNKWLYNLQNATECYDFRRLPSDIMQRVADVVQESVSRVINEIGV